MRSNLECPRSLLVLAFASSLMMSLTHYGTGTAPIIFGSGYTTLNEWWGAGLVMSVVNLLLLIVVGAWWSATSEPELSLSCRP